MVRNHWSFFIKGGKSYEKTNDKDVIVNDDGNNDNNNAADNGISRRNKDTDSKRIRACDQKQDDDRRRIYTECRGLLVHDSYIRQHESSVLHRTRQACFKR